MTLLVLIGSLAGLIAGVYLVFWFLRWAVR